MYCPSLVSCINAYNHAIQSFLSKFHLLVSVSFDLLLAHRLITDADHFLFIVMSEITGKVEAHFLAAFPTS